MPTRSFHDDPVSIGRAIDKAVGTRGKSQFNGTGAQTAFVIPHGLGVIPTSVSVEAGSAAAAALAYVSAVDATNITYTFSAAPASGSNNVVLWWIAIP